MILIYWIEESVGLIGIEDFIAVHDGYEVFGVAEVDDIMGVAREHVDSFNLVATHLPLQHFAFRVVKVALLDEDVTLLCFLIFCIYSVIAACLLASSMLDKLIGNEGCNMALNTLGWDCEGYRYLWNGAAFMSPDKV